MFSRCIYLHQLQDQWLTCEQSLNICLKVLFALDLYTCLNVGDARMTTPLRAHRQRSLTHWGFSSRATPAVQLQRTWNAYESAQPRAQEGSCCWGHIVQNYRGTMEKSYRAGSDVMGLSSSTLAALWNLTSFKVKVQSQTATISMVAEIFGIIIHECEHKLAACKI